MKIRQGFVSNSSSSSFVIMSVGETKLLDECGDDYGYASLNIDDVIAQLQEAKEKGITAINIEFGGGYDG